MALKDGSLRSRFFFPFSMENRALKRENERAVVNVFSIRFFFQGPRGRGGSLGRGGTPGIPVSKCYFLVLQSTVLNNYSTSARPIPTRLPSHGTIHPLSGIIVI